MSLQKQLSQHHSRLAACTLCAQMIGPVIIGNPVISDILQLGQAPGIHEGRVGKPFGWTAGKTLFKWYQRIGVDEQTVRSNVYMAAVCRCFPGKHPKHGDRVPNKTEISACSHWLKAEIQLLRPKLIIPVGKLAIAQIMKVDRLKDVIGKTHRLEFHDLAVDIIPLPHPSGASTWHNMQPGKILLQNALDEISQHPSWAKLTSNPKI
jgi:uracil-DNA glycosylase